MFVRAVLRPPANSGAEGLGAEGLDVEDLEGGPEVEGPGLDELGLERTTTVTGDVDCRG
jgi:hypothetical protein